jgi:hypothetical protein
MKPDRSLYLIVIGLIVTGTALLSVPLGLIVAGFLLAAFVALFVSDF